jgi:exopolysaccharide biosynthesis WecB/TagA/CpsF family protein
MRSICGAMIGGSAPLKVERRYCAGRDRMSEVERTEEFLGLGFHCDNLDGATQRLLNEEPQVPFRYVVTPNVHDMVRLLENPVQIAPLYADAWRTYCDSRVLRRLARLYGRQLSLVTGSDLTVALLTEANRLGLQVLLIGPQQEDGAELGHRFPQIKIVTHTPPMGFIASESAVKECVDAVVRARAPLVFLAVGMPRQLILAHRIAKTEGATGIGLCIGASIDFLTGKQRRAPLWMQRAGVEWLYRLLSEPRRLASRYLIECPRIFYLLLRQPPPFIRGRSPGST